MQTSMSVDSSANLNLIHNYLKGIPEETADDTPGNKMTLEELNAKVDSTTAEQFLALAKAHPFAFGGRTAPDTFREAVVALEKTTHAMRKNGFNKNDLEHHVKQLDIKVARSTFRLLNALHNQTSSYEAFAPQINGRTFPEGLPMVLDFLQQDPAIREREYLASQENTLRGLAIFGNHAAPAFLEECSPNLLALSLSGVRVKHVLPSIGNFKSLVDLDLSSNPMRKLPEEVGNLTTLRTLNVSKCTKLEALPDAIGRCASLVKLLARESGLKSLPDSAASLTNLQKVDMRKTSYDPNSSAVYPQLMQRGVTVKAGGKPAEESGQRGGSPAGLGGALGGGLPGLGGGHLSPAVLAAMMATQEGGGAPGCPQQ